MTTNADELIRRANAATKNIAARGDDNVTKYMVELNGILAVVMTSKSYRGVGLLL